MSGIMAFHQAVQDLLREVSQKAILPYYQKLAEHHVEPKEAGDVVTVADKLSEEMLAEGLTKIADIPVVGEEAGDGVHDAEPVGAGQRQDEGVQSALPPAAICPG